MFDEATLATTVLAFAWIVYHCREWKKERVQFSQWLEVRSDSFSTLASDAMEALEDIVDGVQATTSGSGSAHPSNPVTEILTALLMSKTGLPLSHASTTQQERQVLQTESDTPSIEVQESD